MYKKFLTVLMILFVSLPFTSRISSDDTRRTIRLHALSKSGAGYFDTSDITVIKSAQYIGKAFYEDTFR